MIAKCPWCPRARWYPDKVYVDSNGDSDGVYAAHMRAFDNKRHNAAFWRQHQRCPRRYQTWRAQDQQMAKHGFMG